MQCINKAVTVLYSTTCSDVNKDLGPKAMPRTEVTRPRPSNIKAKAKDLDPKPKPRTLYVKVNG